MASRREDQQQEIQFKVMRLLQEDPTITTREIARCVKISNGSAHYCITALIEKGYIKLRSFTKSRNKVNYFYELTPRGIKTKALLTVKFLERKREEYNDLKVEIERLENELSLGANNSPKNQKGSI